MSIDPHTLTCKQKRVGRFPGRLYISGAIAVFAAMFNATSTQAQAARPPGIPDCFEYKTHPLRNGQACAYLLYLPAQYDDDKNHKWPVIITLHGSGECGNVAKMAGMALPRYVASRPTKFPFIVIAVNAPTMWYRGDNAVAVFEILEKVQAEYRTDSDRVYLTGYSMGGFATWELSILRPDLFAAIIPVCGRGIPPAAENIATMPTWAFHGARDSNVPVSGSREMIAAMKAAGGEPRYTEYPALSHEIWEGVYRSMDVYKWLLKQRRSAPPKEIKYTMVGPFARAWWLTLVASPENGLHRAHAQLKDDGHVQIDSTGVAHWLIESNGPPLAPGQAVDVIWNGERVYKGVFQGAIGVQPTSRPAAVEGDAASKPARP